jgi:hypothetical protein
MGSSQVTLHITTGPEELPEGPLLRQVCLRGVCHIFYPQQTYMSNHLYLLLFRLEMRPLVNAVPTSTALSMKF